MEEKQIKGNSKQWLFAIIFLLVLMAITIVYIIFDARKVVKYDEVSKSGLLTLSKADDVTTAAKGKVIVNYVDTEGNKILESAIYEGNIGAEYKIERPEIDGYLTFGNEPYQKTGNYQKEEIEIDFIYQDENANVEIDEENNRITVKMKNAKQPKEYSIKIITKTEDGELIKGVDYLACKSTGEVLRSGTVEGETFVVGTITINEEGTDTLTIEETAAPYYEALFGEEFDFSIKKVWDESKNTFMISVDYEKDIDGLEIKVEENEIIINVVNKLLVDDPELTPDPEPEPTPEPEPEPTPEPDPEPTPEPEPEPTPEPEDKLFDLEITKYISNIKIQNEKGSTQVNRGIDKKDKLFKIEVDAKELAKTKLDITYKILVENIGNIPGYATEITDFIPKDLEFVANEDWELKDNNLIYTGLQGELLNPGDKKELELTFTWQLGDNKLGARKNQAEITGYKNSYEIKDFTPDNIGSAELIVSIRTGKEEACVLGILGILTSIATVMYMKKRKIEKENN